MSTSAGLMRAVFHTRYGPPEKVLRVGEVPVPEPADDEALVRVHAASVHPDVWHTVVGRPYFLRLMGNGLWRPKPSRRVPGTDVAGVVEACGAGVERFAAGDEVFGEVVRGHQWKSGGSFAEHVATPVDRLEPMPKGLSFEEAAAVPTSGLIAVQAVRDDAKVEPGERVLVNGAGGSLGVFVVQLAKHVGAEVTGVDRAHKLDTLRAIGADHAIDFEAEDPTRPDEPYDVVIDIASTFSLADIKRAVRPDGRYLLIGHDHYGAGAGRVLGSVRRFLWLGLASRWVDQLPGFNIVEDPGDRLPYLAELIAAGAVRPVVGRTFGLDEVVEAFGCLARGEAVGKVVLTF